MKKSFKFFLSIFILNILVVGAVFADGYHVCVASYKSLDNAETMLKKLEKQSVSALVSENKVKNQTYYRVLLSKEFKKAQDARKYRDEVKNYSFVKELGLKDFWVCESEKIVLRNQLVKITTDLPQPAKVAPAPAPKKVVEEKPAPKAKPAPVPVPVPAPLPIPEEPDVKNIVPEDAKSVAPLPIIVPIPQPEPELPVEEEPEEPEEPAEEIPVIVVEEPKTLGANEKAVLSEENPYSVIVRSYKYEQFAENDSARLKELGFEPYILKTFDDKEFFAFNIHVGAFASLDEAEELNSQFADAGIPDTMVSDYNEIKENLQKYDDVILRESVSFDNGQYEIPTCVPESIAKLVKQFPANKDFPIQEITIIDYDNYLAVRDKPNLSSELRAYLEEEEGLHSALLAKCRDELYRKEVSVFFANADQHKEDDILGEFENMQFGATDGVFDCVLYENDGELVLSGTNISEKMCVKIKTRDFSKEEFINLLIDSFNDGSLSLYPQMRRTFYVLPDKNPDDEREFIIFNFKKVGEEYASERNYAEWAVPIVGHSLAKSYFYDSNSLLCIGFYDLDYDFNAKNVHAHFTEAKNTTEITETNKPVSVNGIEGWYLLNPKQKEVSFSTKSYVIAIDTEPTSVLSKDDLIKVGTDLKIWDSGSDAGADFDAK